MSLLFSNEYKSPNFSPRQSSALIDTIIIHYTGMKNSELALNYLCSQKSNVSAHYFINENGKLWQIVEDRNIAWHAGVSKWLDRKNLNETSIGIELVNPGHSYGYKEFTFKQYEMLEKLIILLMRKYNIKLDRILGHSDIAPARKIDPGEYFDWHRLAKKKLSIWPKNILTVPKDIYSNKLLYNLLLEIGYDVENYYKDSILAFKRRFIPNDLTYNINDILLNVVYSVHNEFVKVRSLY
jgi:N-acetylmuramoyl-L-alanine amidase